MITQKKLREEYPNCYKVYQSLNGHHFKYLSIALENIFLNFGLDPVISPVFHETQDRVIGHISKIKVNPTNTFGIEEDIIVIEDLKKYKTYNKAQDETFRFTLNLLEEKLTFFSANNS